MNKNAKEDKKPAKCVIIGEQMAKVEDPVAVVWLEEYKRLRSKDDEDTGHGHSRNACFQWSATPPRTLEFGSFCIFFF